MSLNLFLGNTVNLTETYQDLDTFIIGLGWDVNSDGQDFDLDAVAILLDDVGECKSIDDVVYYDHLEHASGALMHMGDNRTGEGDGDDEQILIALNRLPDYVKRVVFIISIFSAEERNQTFSNVSNAYIRIANPNFDEDIARYNLCESFPNDSAVAIASIYRDCGQWVFEARADGISGGMAGIADKYGL